jgi:hypothetical protein
VRRRAARIVRDVRLGGGDLVDHDVVFPPVDGAARDLRSLVAGWPWPERLSPGCATSSVPVVAIAYSTTRKEPWARDGIDRAVRVELSRDEYEWLEATAAVVSAGRVLSPRTYSEFWCLARNSK